MGVVLYDTKVIRRSLQEQSSQQTHVRDREMSFGHIRRVEGGSCQKFVSSMGSVFLQEIILSKLLEQLHRTIRCIETVVCES